MVINFSPGLRVESKNKIVQAVDSEALYIGSFPAKKCKQTAHKSDASYPGMTTLIRKPWFVSHVP
jgi:hypothetical protein